MEEDHLLQRTRTSHARLQPPHYNHLGCPKVVSTNFQHRTYASSLWTLSKGVHVVTFLEQASSAFTDIISSTGFCRLRNCQMCIRKTGSTSAVWSCNQLQLVEAAGLRAVWSFGVRFARQPVIRLALSLHCDRDIAFISLS